MKRFILKSFKQQRISTFKTLLINFKCLPLRQAIHLPIYVYTDCIIKSMGIIRIEAPIERGMIRIGKRNFFGGYKTLWSNAGTFIFRGYALIEGGTQVQNCGTIDFGAEARFCECLKVLIVNKLTIGTSTQIAFESVIMDTDFHNIVSMHNQKVKSSIAPIRIGSYNWIGNRCLVRKGTITPNHTIAATCSVLSGDYTPNGDNILLAGNPAKCIRLGWRRLWKNSSKKDVSDFFRNNPCLQEYNLTDISNWDIFTVGDKQHGGDNFLPHNKYCYLD